MVTATALDSNKVELEVSSGCEVVTKMMETLGSTFDAFQLCLARPGRGPLYEYASGNFPAHCGCPVISGITKCAEAECKLALKRDVSISFLDE